MSFVQIYSKKDTFLSMWPRYFAPKYCFSEFIHEFATYLNVVIDSRIEAIIARKEFLNDDKDV